MTYRFKFDPESGAMYFRFRDGEISETVQVNETGFGAYLDIDAEGRVLGVEFLSLEEFKELLAQTGGKLVIPEWFGADAPDVGGTVGNIGEAPSQALTAAAPPIRRRALSDHDRALLEEAVASLDPTQRQILRLYFHDGYTLKETAEHLGISIATAYQKMRSALDQVRDRLRGEAPAEDQRSLEAALSML